MRDLVLNAYDINQVSVASRQDTAPEDEKRVELHLHTTMSTMDATNPISDYVKQAKKNGVIRRLPLRTMRVCKDFLKRLMLPIKMKSK